MWDDGYGHMDGGWGGVGMGWGSLLMWVLLMVLLATAAAVVVVLARAGTAGSAGAGSGPSAIGPATTARGLLDERYARGEIDEQEYRERRTTLRRKD